MEKFGCSAQLYCIFENGICYEYIPGQVIDSQSVKDPQVNRLLIKEMAKMHNIKLEVKNTTPVLFTKMDKFIKMAFVEELPKKKNVELPCTMEYFLNEVAKLKEHLIKLNSPIVFAHNDLLLHNIIYNKEKAFVKFIDFEYAGPNYEAFDIANHFNEFGGENDDRTLYPAKGFQLIWLRCYLYERKLLSANHFKDIKVTDTEVEKLYVQVNKFLLACFLFWTVWAIVQAKYSTKVEDFDYIRYAKDCLEEYSKHKEEVWSLRIPS